MTYTVSSGDLTWSEYVEEVLALPRAEVTNVYAQLYREVDSLTWPYEDDGETLRPGVVEGEAILLSDEDVRQFAEQDHADNPRHWAFQPADDSGENS